MDFVPVIIKADHCHFHLCAVFKTDQIVDGIKLLLNAVPDEMKTKTKKIVIGPTSSAKDALLYNEAHEAHAKKTKNARVVRARNYDEKREKAFANKKQKK